MADVSLAEPTRQMDSEESEMMERMLDEIQHLNALLRRDRAEIERLKTETAFLKAQTQEMKVFGMELHNESRAILDQLKRVVMQ